MIVNTQQTDTFAPFDHDCAFQSGTAAMVFYLPLRDWAFFLSLHWNVNALKQSNPMISHLSHLPVEKVRICPNIQKEQSKSRGKTTPGITVTAFKNVSYSVMQNTKQIYRKWGKIFKVTVKIKFLISWIYTLIVTTRSIFLCEYLSPLEEGITGRSVSFHTQVLQPAILRTGRVHVLGHSLV